MPDDARPTPGQADKPPDVPGSPAAQIPPAQSELDAVYGKALAYADGNTQKLREAGGLAIKLFLVRQLPALVASAAGASLALGALIWIFASSKGALPPWTVMVPWLAGGGLSTGAVMLRGRSGLDKNPTPGGKAAKDQDRD